MLSALPVLKTAHMCLLSLLSQAHGLARKGCFTVTRHFSQPRMTRTWGEEDGRPALPFSRCICIIPQNSADEQEKTKNARFVRVNESGEEGLFNFSF